MKNFDFEEERILSEIIKYDAKRVLIQMPQGLKSESTRLAKTIEKIGVLPIVSADPCYGSCDIIDFNTKRFGIDLVFHFGHSEMIKSNKIPIIYLDVKSKIKIDKVVKASLPFLKKYLKIGLTTTIQHIQTLESAKDLLVYAGKEVHIGKSNKMLHSGQVTGCNYDNVKSIATDVESFLFIGGGFFHALGVAVNTSKPTILANPFNQEIRLLEEQANRLLKQHWTLIQKAKKAKTFGIIVGLKLGQENFNTALRIKKIIEKKGKTSIIMFINEIKPGVLMDFTSIDAYINTACPRISFDAPSKFLRPVLTVNEFKVLSGEYTWEDMIKRGLFQK
ncbi:MAG: hypothetical protein AC479_01030 [miscellaneous Crenarchaeota group-6 archaeon AD8-1]|nr:MAG: hypothetical protein AC479_01030 [miscellaneous Crenarchaeota group-6 archaeon AD8-1]